MPKSQNLGNTPERNSMVQDIFKTIESRGINDRELKDDIANQVIQKLEQEQVLQQPARS